jgi:hypothetical protein
LKSVTETIEASWLLVYLGVKNPTNNLALSLNCPTYPTSMLRNPRLQALSWRTLKWYHVAASDSINYRRFHTIPKQPHASHSAESKYRLGSNIGDVVSMFLEDESVNDFV